MILHIAEDEKFIDHVIDVFETVQPNNNLYLINNESNELRYIKTQTDNIKVYRYGSKEYMQIVKDKYSFSAIIFHNLIHQYKWEIIETINSSIPIHWMSWGADLYFLPQFRKDLYQTNTKKYINNNISLIIKLKNIAENISPSVYGKLLFSLTNKNTNYLRFKGCIKKIKSVSTVLPNELFLIQKHLNSQIKYIPFKYISLEKLTSGVSNNLCNSQDFLIGNSAYPTNNHLDIFDLLSKSKINNKKLYIPLSYGNKKYATEIINIGDQIFGERFIPLTKFLPINEYNKIILNCGNVIINSNRQQAVGNILIALWLGAKVFINKANLTYNYFNELNIRFFDLKHIKDLYLQNNCEELATHNRPIIKKLYDKENILQETENLIKQLIS